MKKKLVAIASLILAFLMSVVSLGGCNLVTTDSKKDMEQVVATVSIADGVEGKVYKQDLIMDYLNYGYSYVQYQSYTMEQVMELIIYNRVNTMILVQNAKQELNKRADCIENSSKGVWDAERYLDGDDVYEAEYSVYKSVCDMLDSFATEKDPVKVSEASTATVRTAPTNAANDEEVSLEEKKEFVDDVKESGFNIGPAPERREAFNKFINFLRINSILGEGYANNDIKTTDYFVENMKNELDGQVLEKYREVFRQEKLDELNLSYAKVGELYAEKYNDQTKWDNEEFVAALDAATVNDPVLYGVNGTYGYVYNLLLGVDDIQDERIKAIDTKLANSEQAAQRKEVLKSTRVTDLRTSWITSGYDFDFDNKKFTGDYTFTSAARSLAYQGDVILHNPDREEDEKAEYWAKAKTMGLDEFIKSMNAYMLDDDFNSDKFDDTKLTQNANEYTKNSELANSIYDVYGAATYNQDVKEYDEKINEMIFAFSTDDGSLNKYKGYVIKPEVDADNAETYVATFATAGRKLLEIGGQSYVIVESKFGYHVLFFSEVFKAGENATLEQYANMEAFLDANCNKGEYGSWEAYYNDMMSKWFDWEDTDNYLYILQSSVCTNRINNALNRHERSKVNEFLYEKDGKVVINEDTYADLID